MKGQVIVDYRAWNHWGPGDDFANLGDATAEIVDANTWLASTVRKHNLHSIASKAFEVRCKEGDLLDDEYALIPPRLLGYIPVNKIFAQLSVGWLLPVEDKNKDQVWNSDLILDEDKKKIIRTLVENHAQMADKRTPDLVEGKGNGLVILLHGPPGVGKSLTAECVAKATSKPLFTVGVADIGTDSGTVEDRLNKLFSLAAEWDAVLLFDEADVFMEQRGSNRLHSRAQCPSLSTLARLRILRVNTHPHHESRIILRCGRAEPHPPCGHVSRPRRKPDALDYPSAPGKASPQGPRSYDQFVRGEGSWGQSEWATDPECDQRCRSHGEQKREQSDNLG